MLIPIRILFTWNHAFFSQKKKLADENILHFYSKEFHRTNEILIKGRVKHQRNTCAEYFWKSKVSKHDLINIYSFALQYVETSACAGNSMEKCTAIKYYLRGKLKYENEEKSRPQICNWVECCIGTHFKGTLVIKRSLFIAKIREWQRSPGYEILLHRITHEGYWLSKKNA